jgi:hypothetical protein
MTSLRKGAFGQIVVVQSPATQLANRRRVQTSKAEHELTVCSNMEPQLTRRTDPLDLHSP